MKPVRQNTFLAKYFKIFWNSEKSNFFLDTSKFLYKWNEKETNFRVSAIDPIKFASIAKTESTSWQTRSITTWTSSMTDKVCFRVTFKHSGMKKFGITHWRYFNFFFAYFMLFFEIARKSELKQFLQVTKPQTLART